MTSSSSSILRVAAGTAAAALSMIVVPRDADACGGCFHPQAEVGASVITDHRMALKVSTKETILWDQVRYAGAPEEFAWVLPVREGAKIELSRDAFLTALDAATQSRVDGPHFSCASGTATPMSGGGGGGGCGSFGSSLSSADDAEYSSGGYADAGAAPGSDVEVVSQSVVGPYQAVTIRAKNGATSIDTWLKDNGFAIPETVTPVIDAYTREGFDFIALRLRPGQGVRAMRPVRVVTPGADPTLPLRMVAAGIGSHVGLTLWVISEGRYEPKNYPGAVIDETKLTWDGANNRSNLSVLASAALASNDGRTWLTEAAIRQDLGETYGSYFGTQSNPTLRFAYQSQCISRPAQRVPCSEQSSELPPADGSPDEGYPDTTGEEDGGADAGEAPDASGGSSGTVTDAGTKPRTSPQCWVTVQGCDGFDDLDVTTRGLHTGDTWITRLRADLPVQALDQDLKLGAASSQQQISPERKTATLSDPNWDPCANVPGAGGSNATPSNDSDGSCACRTTRMRNDGGSFVLVAATAFLASRIARRRRRS